MTRPRYSASNVCAQHPWPKFEVEEKCPIIRVSVTLCARWRVIVSFRCQSMRLKSCCIRSSMRSVHRKNGYVCFTTRSKTSGRDEKLLHVETLAFMEMAESSCSYSPFPRRRDSNWSWECKTKSSMVITGLFSIGSNQKRRRLWPSKNSICILTRISNLIFSGTDCICEKSSKICLPMVPKPQTVRSCYTASIKWKLFRWNSSLAAFDGIRKITP